MAKVLCKQCASKRHTNGTGSHPEPAPIDAVLTTEERMDNAQREVLDLLRRGGIPPKGMAEELARRFNLSLYGANSAIRQAEVEHYGPARRHPEPAEVTA